ncbi:MAG TPA: thioredoxin domain-containing protein [Streptosporangiaceae bacterium]
MNRLGSSTSPYLLQHADNPVDWWPWSGAAFAEAARRDVPVLLSVGYAACHWCHVMAHESFEDAETAALLNDHVVAIKVDREERPDVDSVYMTATQAMTGQGGWPMTVFMTPDKEPFYCGTYFPRAQFQQLILAISRAWQTQRSDVEGQATNIAKALAANAEATTQALRSAANEVSFADRPAAEGPRPSRPGDTTAGSVAGGGSGGLVFTPWINMALGGLEKDYDGANGGFGGAPKFPPSMVIEFLLRHHERTGSPGALAMAAGTLEAMARGGMYDQLGGGFARYSVDASWVMPHFEKMLYDNALLARAYGHHWRRSGSELARRVVSDTCDWMLSELRTPEGGLAASLDADSAGEEGKFYVWTPAQLEEVLGAGDAGFAAAAFGVTSDGTFEHGASVLQLRADPADPERFARIRSALLAAREERVRPGRDDKIVAAWNGLAISALAEAGLLLDRPELIAAATGAAELLAATHRGDGRLIRTSRDGVAGDTAGALEDYACVAEGFLTLSGVTGQARWVGLAGELLDVALSAFGDGAGGFYDTAADDESLIFRPADAADNATPSGTFAVAGALLSYAALTGSARHREAAEAALGVLGGIAVRFPRAAGAGLAVAEALIAGPSEIAVVGPAGDARTAELHRTALLAAPPGAVIAVGDGSLAAETIPLLAGRELVGEKPAAYVCRDFTCRAPVTTPDQLREILATP